MVGSRVLGITEYLANFENVWYDIAVAVSRAGYLVDAYPQQYAMPRVRRDNASARQRIVPGVSW